MKLSGNVLINSLLPLVVEFFDEQFLSSLSNEIEIKKGYQEHFEMVDALQNGDLDKLSTVIRSHLNGYLKNYDKKIMEK